MHWSKSCVIFMNFWWLHLSRLGTSALSWELWRLMDGNVYPESSWDLSILSGARTNGREANVPTGRGVQFSSCKFLQERGGLVDQLHLLHDCLVGTHTHTHMHSHTHLCPHPHMDVPTHVYTQTHTVRHGNRSFWLLCLSGGGWGQRRVLCTAFASHQKERDFPLQRAPAQNGLCIHDVILQCVTAHLEDVSA